MEPEERPAPDPNDARQRFLLELEFIQCLANPIYIHYLAQNRYFEDEAFIGYLKYLMYWQRPEYIKYIMYPHCLFFLELLQNANFRNAMAHPASKEIAHREQYFFWKNYRNNRMKHILPRPPSEQTPASAPATVLPAAPMTVLVVPPVAAPPSSLPPMSAVGASAMSPMQFTGTPGTNIPKNDMRNAMGGRKRKYAHPLQSFYNISYEVIIVVCAVIFCLEFFSCAVSIFFV
ncbi:hypothetical protein GUJ93_ZPchr0012g20829 [Zizania palustris]|uniref:Mediator of RNA polymerase II transcription subunit 31 n=1 Tax=Zizania palustris TaxID=103762 RepID=A0A8J6BWB2_ZIZPA|nr:hypothetical protein GUJ93_ZPchr0012g20829 [Zizania palustris]